MSDRPTYAEQEGERVLARLLDVAAGGLYVDVGCAEELGSNTLWLYDRGWHGLLVDARLECSIFAQERRPRDAFVRAAVTDRDGGAVEMIVQGNLSRLVTIGGVSGDRTFRAPSITLNTLAWLFPQFSAPELFSLDVEAAEALVLSVCNFNLFRPALMVVEHQTRGVGSTRAAWEPYVAPFYEEVDCDPVNAFFRRRASGRL